MYSLYSKNVLLKILFRTISWIINNYLTLHNETKSINNPFSNMSYIYIKNFPFSNSKHNINTY